MIEFYSPSHPSDKLTVVEINRQKAEERFPRSNFFSSVCGRHEEDAGDEKKKIIR